VDWLVECQAKCHHHETEQGLEGRTTLLESSNGSDGDWAHGLRTKMFSWPLGPHIPCAVVAAMATRRRTFVVLGIRLPRTLGAQSGRQSPSLSKLCASQLAV